MQIKKTSEIKAKILAGSKLALQKLVAKKRLENSYLIISDNGKVIKKQASDITL